MALSVVFTVDQNHERVTAYTAGRDKGQRSVPAVAVLRARQVHEQLRACFRRGFDRQLVTERRQRKSQGEQGRIAFQVPIPDHGKLLPFEPIGCWRARIITAPPSRSPLERIVNERRIRLSAEHRMAPRAGFGQRPCSSRMMRPDRACSEYSTQKTLSRQTTRADVCAVAEWCCTAESKPQLANLEIQGLPGANAEHQPKPWRARPKDRRARPQCRKLWPAGCHIAARAGFGKAAQISVRS